MTRFRALAVLGLVLLSGALVPALTAQQVPDEVREIQIPEGVKDVKYTKVRIDGETFWKITGVIDEQQPPLTRPGEAPPTIDVRNPFGAIRVQVRAVQEPLLQARALAKRSCKRTRVRCRCVSPRS